jgi:hypothetical protein
MTHLGAGVYQVTLSFEDVDAFYRDFTLTGTIEISAPTFVSYEKTLTVTVKMEEMFEGFPAFYFWILVGAAIFVAGTYTATRVIQTMRIPPFVRLINATTKAVKAKKRDMDTSIVPTKEDYYESRLESAWKVLGLRYPRLTPEGRDPDLELGGN